MRQQAEKFTKQLDAVYVATLAIKGRKAIFEMMVLNNEIRELAFNRAPLGQIRQAAIRAGMRTLVEDGKIKILRGDTTPEEIARFAQAEALTRGKCGYLK